MSKKSERRKNQSTSSPNHEGRDHNPHKHEVRSFVQGTIEVGRIPCLEEQHHAERKEDTTLDKKKYLVEKITLISLFIVAGLSFWEGWLTRSISKTAQKQLEISQSANRPFIGIASFMPAYLKSDHLGHMSSSPTQTKETVGMGIICDIKNFGPMPGMKFSATWEIYLGGVLQKSERVRDSPITLNPSAETGLKTSIGTDNFADVESGLKTIVVNTTWDYEGVEGTKYHECQKHQYDYRSHGFLILGACDK